MTGEAPGGEAVHRRLGDLPDRVENGHNADVHVSAKLLEGGVAGHLYQAVGKAHNKGGEAQGGDPPHPAGGQAQRIPGQPQRRLPAGEEF